MTPLRCIALALAAALLTACGGGTSQPVTGGSPGTVAPVAPGGGGQALQINGAGATFPNPIYSKRFIEYNKLTKAAAGATIPPDFRVSITNASGAGAYPISSFTWILLYQDPMDKASGKAMVDFMHWALTDGQQFAPDLGYAPLLTSVVTMEMAALDTLKAS